jgi:tetratricopeptide (TPR) repeat protein
VPIPVHRFSSKLASFLIVLAIALLCPHGSAASQQNPSDFDSLAQAAAAARESGRASEAIPLYRQALELRPDWAEGWWYLGTLLYDADQCHNAIPALQKVLTLAPDAPGTSNFLGLCEYETGDYDSALQHLERGYGQRSQDDAQLARVATYHFVALLNGAGNFTRASEILTKDFSHGVVSDQVTILFGLTSLRVPILPSEIDPSKDALVQTAGHLAILLAQGQASEALDGYPALLQQYPNAPFLHSAYAAALQSAGSDKEAAAQLQLESSLDSNRSAAVAFYANDAARTRFGLSSSTTSSSTPGPPAPSNEQSWQLATQLFASGHYAEAIPPLKATIAAHPDNGTAWAMLGFAEFEIKDYDNALLHLQKGASLGLGGSADSVRFAKYRLGLLLIRQSQFDQASTLLVPEAEGNSLSQQIQFALGLALLHKPLFPEAVPTAEISLVQSAGEVSVLLHNSKYDLAFPKLQKLIESYPNAVMLHYVYGVALSSFSRYDEAAAQFAAESRINPKSELPYVQAAFVQLQAHRPADALVSAQHAVQLAPGSAEAYYVLGRSLLDTGNFEGALKKLQLAAQINPGSPEVHFNLAKTYAKLNRPEDAQRERERFAQLNSEMEKQRSQHGSQAYGAAHSASELSQSAPVSVPSPPPTPHP